MISDTVLEQAVVRGVLSDRQAGDLRALVREIAATSAAEPQDDEALRFATGFNDIFVTLGLGLFVGALAYFASFSGRPAMWSVLATAAWLLAEFFTRRKRMALPSIALLALFTVSVFGATGLLLKQIIVGLPERMAPLSMWGYDKEHPWIIVAAGLFTAAMTSLHHVRFRVPITIAAGAAALVVALMGLLLAVFPSGSEKILTIALLLAGCAVFALAMRFDLSDPERVTRRNDIAFWLHLLAAPLIVHPLIRQIGANAMSPQVWMAVGVLAIFVVLGAVAVVIDRRALLVSGLIYAGYALGSLIERAGFTDQATPATFLALGAFVLLLSAGWRPARRILLGLLPVPLARKLPHLLASS